MISWVNRALFSLEQVALSRISAAKRAPSVVEGQVCFGAAMAKPFEPRWWAGLVLVTSRKPVSVERWPEPWHPGHVVVRPNVLPILPSPPQTPQLSDANEYAHSQGACRYFGHRAP